MPGTVPGRSVSADFAVPPVPSESRRPTPEDMFVSIEFYPITMSLY